MNATPSSLDVLSIEARAVACEYATVRVLNDISFDLPAGRVLALVGPNGAGKTTLLAALAGMHALSAGTIRFQGASDVVYDTVDTLRALRAHLGVLLDRFGLYPTLTARECITYAARSRGVSAGDIDRYVRWTLDFCALNEYADTRTETLSRGWRQWVGIAQALVARPRVLLLDEPASGLDPGARERLGERLRWLSEKERVTTVVSSHILSELEGYADAMLIIADGRIRAFYASIPADPHALRTLYREALPEGEESSDIERWTS